MALAAAVVAEAAVVGAVMVRRAKVAKAVSRASRVNRARRAPRVSPTVTSPTPAVTPVSWLQQPLQARP